MKITFVCSEDKWLGVGYLSSYLKEQGHEVSLLFDPMFFNKAYLRSKRLKKFFSKDREFIREIQAAKPDLLGFSVVTANYQWALEKAALFKEHFSIPIIFGGVHPTIMPDEVLSQPQVDMIALGEAEESLLELLNTGLSKKDIRGIWFKEAGRVIYNPLRPLESDIDKYPFPDDDLFYAQLPPSYRISPSVITSRGCPFSCTYCGNQLMQKLYRDSGSTQWVRQRSVGNVIEELIWRKEVHKSRHFVFMDDIFSLNLDWLKEFSEEYKKTVNLPFNCLSHPSFAKEETIKLLKEAGCTLINFGLQSGSPEMREKVLNRSEKNEEVKSIAEACRREKLPFAVDCILNLPGDNEQSIKESMSFYNVLRPDIINCYRLLYFPGTKIVDIARESGLLSEAELEMINKGNKNRYTTMGIAGQEFRAVDYRRYSFLMTIIPLLSEKWVSRIIDNKRLFLLFRKIPLFLLPLAKIIVQLKAGFGFIFFNVIRNELYYFFSLVRKPRTIT